MSAKEAMKDEVRRRFAENEPVSPLAIANWYEENHEEDPENGILSDATRACIEVLEDREERRRQRAIERFKEEHPELWRSDDDA